QQLESNVFAPRVYGQALELPSPVVLIAISIGGILGNVLGMFLATPVAAVLAALLRNRPMTHTNGTPEEGHQTSRGKSREEASLTSATPKKNEDSTGGVSDRPTSRTVKGMSCGPVLVVLRGEAASRPLSFGPLLPAR